MRLPGPARRSAYIETSLGREKADAPPSAGFREVFGSNVVWRLVLVHFFIQVGFYSFNLWLPHLVKTTIEGSYLVVGAVTAIPYVFAIAGLWFNARSADHSGRYSVHVLASLAVGRWRWCCRWRSASTPRCPSS